jgi:3-dehydroquinate synthase
MSDMVIRSKFKEYAVRFVEDFTVPLQRETKEGAFVIMDGKVVDLYRKRLNNLLKEDRYLVVEASETNKTLEKSKEVFETLVEKKIRRDQKLIAVGGGVIQDLSAFTASLLYRGIEWSFFPTTLLAQADSCIGGKTSINLGDKKNIIGNFYPPSAVYIDTAFLETLETDDIKSGIGEMLHFYYYADSPCFDKLIGNYAQAVSNRLVQVEYIKESLSIKKSVIEVDEFDKGERNKFNYGHTFGHALESLTKYKIKHGQAVTVGMDIANYLSLRLALMSKEIFDKTHVLLIKNFPQYPWEQFCIEEYIGYLAKDKKNVGQDLVCILAERPGCLIKKRITMNESFQEIVQSYFHEIISDM